MAADVAPELFGAATEPVKEGPGQEVSFECPFCQYTSSKFTSRCTNCGEELGVLNW